MGIYVKKFISIFSLFFNCDFVIYIDTHVAAANTATDDVTN